MDQETSGHIWLEVSNVRMEKTGGSMKVEVQLKGDRSAREPQWWPVAPEAAGKGGEETGKELFRHVDGKKIVLAGLGLGENGKLCCNLIRIQLSDSIAR